MSVLSFTKDQLQTLIRPWRDLAGQVKRLTDGDTTQPTVLDLIKAAAVGAGRQDTFTGTATPGATLDRTSYPVSRFALQVTATGAPGASTAWAVVLEGSLDGVTFTTILTHTYSGSNNGATVWAAAGVFAPVRYLRARCTTYTADGITNIIATILGLP